MGSEGNELDRFVIYLDAQKCEKKNNSKDIHVGVPQGSIFGPTLFGLCLKSL